MKPMVQVPIIQNITKTITVLKKIAQCFLSLHHIGIKFIYPHWSWTSYIVIYQSVDHFSNLILLRHYQLCKHIFPILVILSWKWEQIIEY